MLGVKTAMIWCVPTARKGTFGGVAGVNVEVARFPLPVSVLPWPRSFVPSKNSTVPVGVLLVRRFVIVAVKVGGVWNEELLAELLTVVFMNNASTAPMSVW